MNCSDVCIIHSKFIHCKQPSIVLIFKTENEGRDKVTADKAVMF